MASRRQFCEFCSEKRNQKKASSQQRSHTDSQAGVARQTRASRTLYSGVMQYSTHEEFSTASASMMAVRPIVLTNGQQRAGHQPWHRPYCPSSATQQESCRAHNGRRALLLEVDPHFVPTTAEGGTQALDQRLLCPAIGDHHCRGSLSLAGACIVPEHASMRGPHHGARAGCR